MRRYLALLLGLDPEFHRKLLAARQRYVRRERTKVLFQGYEIAIADV